MKKYYIDFYLLQAIALTLLALVLAYVHSHGTPVPAVVFGSVLLALSLTVAQLAITRK